WKGVAGQGEEVFAFDVGFEVDLADRDATGHEDAAVLLLRFGAGGDVTSHLDPQALVIPVLVGAQPPELAGADVERFAAAVGQSDDEGLLVLERFGFFADARLLGTGERGDYLRSGLEPFDRVIGEEASFRPVV